MSKSGKNAAARRPAKAKGTLPAPRVAPHRSRVPWHRRTSFRVLGAVLVAGILALGAWQVVLARSRAEQRRDDRRAVQSFERRVNVLQASARSALSSMNTLPDNYKTGQVSGEEMKTESDKWLEEFRRLSSGIKERQVPSRLEAAKALLLQGTVVYLDAVRAFQIAAAATEPAVREQAVDHGKTLLYHANFVYANGQREIQQQKRALGLDTGQPGETPIQVPEEQAPGLSTPTPAPSPS